MTSPSPGSDPHAARVVVGPRTRLGRGLAGSGSSAGPVRLVVRDARDAAELAPLCDERVTTLDVTEREPARLLDAGRGPVQVVVCALGPVHPDVDDEPGTGAAAWGRDEQAFRRDLDLVAAVLDAAGGRPVHVVLVSTVLALAPGEDRRHYGGWKNLAEASLASLVAASGSADARFSVLYPGRLVDTATTSSWRKFVHTPYPSLVSVVEALLGGREVPRVVGRDARLWLLARSLRLLLGGLRPGNATTARLGAIGHGSTPSRPTESTSGLRG